VLTGAKYLYEVTGKAEYREAILNFGRKYVDEHGVIRGFCAEEQNVDLMASGRLLYFLYDETGEERYLKGIHGIMENLRNQPRTSFGNFWHKKIYPYQVWLDGLYYHAYDETRQMIWANKETGLSPCFWLRSIGWYLLALCDCYEISQDGDAQAVLGGLLKEAIQGVFLYQDKDSGLFYQLVDRADLKNNYLETSGSAMVAYAVMKGCRLGILDREAYYEKGARILAALEAEKMKVSGGEFHLTGTCASAGLGPKDERDGSAEYYLSEAVKDDNAHGVSMCMMAYSEWLKMEELLNDEKRTAV